MHSESNLVQRCILQVFSPLNLICAIAAARSLFKEWSGIVVAGWPGLTATQMSELAAVLKRMIGQFPEIESIRFDLGQALKDFSSDVPVLYAHDVVGDFNERLSALLPNARWICYGEGMGVVFDKDYVLGLLNGREPRRSILDAVLRRPKLKHETALIIPADQTGYSVDTKRMTVIRADVVLDIISRMRASCPEIAEFESEAIERAAGSPSVLLMTENHAEGGFVGVQEEIELYASLLSERFADGATVIVKSHPAEVFPRARLLAELLKDKFSIVTPPKSLNRYPVELMPDLASRATCVCMSYPTVSLKYLYGIEVIQPMTEDVIRKWFPKRVWRSYLDALRLYKEEAAALDEWDGTSLLYRGNKGRPKLKWGKSRQHAVQPAAR